MKKILSLGAAAAVLSLTAVAASAAIAPSFVGEAVTGETVTVEVIANGMTQDATTFTVKASENLTLVPGSAVTTTTGFASFNEATGILAWANSAPAADGTVLLTLTYTVDAAADEEVSFAIVAADGFTDIDAAPAVAIVVDGTPVDVPDPTDEPIEEPTDEPIEEPTDEPTDEPVIETPTNEAESTETPADNGGDDGNNKGNPDTGVALAVVPAVLAGAAIVVAKKRK